MRKRSENDCCNLYGSYRIYNHTVVSSPQPPLQHTLQDRHSLSYFKYCTTVLATFISPMTEAGTTLSRDPFSSYSSSLMNYFPVYLIITCIAIYKLFPCMTISVYYRSQTRYTHENIKILEKNKVRSKYKLRFQYYLLFPSWLPGMLCLGPHYILYRTSQARQLLHSSQMVFRIRPSLEMVV